MSSMTRERIAVLNVGHTVRRQWRQLTLKSAWVTRSDGMVGRHWTGTREADLARRVRITAGLITSHATVAVLVEVFMR
jgi:hypothetical protein